MKRKRLNVLISNQEVKKRITEMSNEISTYYAELVREEKPLLLLCTLRGAVFFAADLVRQLQIPCEMDFVKIHSYSGTRPEGTPVFDLGEHIQVAGRQVLIVEDIVDTGHTMEAMLERMAAAEGLQIATLLDKPSRREVTDITPKFTGFSIADLFVVGWGLDYNEQFRLLPDIMVYDPE